jgi:hypothetical protein
MCGCGHKVCTCGHGHARVIGKFLMLALLFVALSPGILLTIPAAGGKGMIMSGQTSIIAAAVHAVIFVSIVMICRKMYHMYKEHLNQKRIAEIRREMEEHIQSEALEAIMYTQWQQTQALGDLRKNCKATCSARATAIVIDNDNHDHQHRAPASAPASASAPAPSVNAPVKHVEPGQQAPVIQQSNDWYNDSSNHGNLSPASKVPSPSAMLGAPVGGISSNMGVGAPARG